MFVFYGLEGRNLLSFQAYYLMLGQNLYAYRASICSLPSELIIRLEVRLFLGLILITPHCMMCVRAQLGHRNVLLIKSISSFCLIVIVLCVCNKCVGDGSRFPVLIRILSRCFGSPPIHPPFAGQSKCSFGRSLSIYCV